MTRPADGLKLVVSQPMFVPWLGLFEQIRLADVFVHYDDVQLPQGRSFTSRVQIKTHNGMTWMTAPIDRVRSGTLIRECFYQDDLGWRRKHLNWLRQAYLRAPHFETMYELSERIYAFPSNNVAEFNRNAVELIAAFLGLKTEFRSSSEMDVPGTSSDRLAQICEHLGARHYITGHGALRYLDHERFDRSGIGVAYMDYRKVSYPQLHGEFTPFVSVLDAVASCGAGTRELLVSEAVPWREFVESRK